MHSHIFGEVMDIGPDRLSGRQTTATVLGAVPSKLLVAGMLSIETALIGRFFRDPVIAGFLALGALWFVLDALVIWKSRAYRAVEMRLFMWSWNVAALAGIFWNCTHSSLLRVH